MAVRFDSLDLALVRSDSGLERPDAAICVVHGFIILCDFAESINGKLYIQGGGWSRIGVPAGGAVNIYVAALVYIPWDEANRRKRLLLQLFTEDGQEVSLGDPATPVEMRGDLEVGRPPGLRPGVELEVPITARFENLPLQPGRYKFLLTVGASQIGDAKFEVSQAAAPA